jgi:hypothetical protein
MTSTTRTPAGKRNDSTAPVACGWPHGQVQYHVLQRCCCILMSSSWQNNGHKLLHWICMWLYTSVPSSVWSCIHLA